MGISAGISLALGLLVAGCSSSAPELAEPAETSRNLPAAPQLPAKTPARLSTQEALLESAKKFARTPYRLGGQSAKMGADCSAFSREALFSAGFERPPRTTVAQLAAGSKIAINPRKTLANRLKPGDLLFFRARGPHARHVGVYLGGGKFMHLSAHGGARFAHINEAYWRVRLLAAARYQLRD